MKKLLYILCFGLLSMISCEELDRFTMFDVDYGYALDIPAIPVANIPVEIIAPPIPTNSDSILASYDTDAGLVEKATLRMCRLAITPRGNGGLGFLDSIAFSLLAVNIPETRAAWLYDIPEDAGDTLWLETTPDDLKQYITADTIWVKVSFVTDTVTATEQTVKIDLQFRVDAKILGI